ncbi:MAG: Ig domain-containing protein [Kiritimatiellae bacterium]|nr:Ig domain-containing protein [Kiritimatiellia bacterium]
MKKSLRLPMMTIRLLKVRLTSVLAVLLLNAWGDIESTNNVGYTTGADGTQQLVKVVYYNSFDSAEQVAHPAFGPTSICWNVELRDGKKGQALYVPANTPTIGIPFTQGLPQEKGCIEFWAKILPSGASFYDSGNPRFFMFNPKNKPDKMESAFSWLELNGNNGCGQSGWIFAFFSVFKTSHTWGSGSSYPEVFGDLDYRDWHHYVIKWNVDGLSDDATTAIRFSVDNETKIAFSTSEVDPNLLKSYLSKSFEMYWPRPDGDPVSFQKSNVPFLLDELTIWDSDVTESVPPSPSQPAAGSLVYYSTLDSATAVTQPEVGAAGICESSATFGTGKSGQALYVPAGVTVAKIPFPHGLPIEKGLIEFWAKIDTANPTYSSGGNPLFFSFNRTKPDINGNMGTSVTFLEINSNNGWGGSGFSFVLGDIFSSPGVSGWSNAYASLFGESGDQTWHHYELKWNIAGLAEDSQSVCLLKVDGAVKTKTALEKLKVASFKEAMDYPCELTFSYRPNDYSRVPFWIDEFKIWDSDVIGSVVDPTDDPTDDPVAEGLVLSNIAKSYPAGLEIEPIAVTYTGAAEKAKVSVSGLPQGLVFKNGVIAGVPDLPGESTVVVTVKSGSVAVATRTVTIRVSNYADDLVSGLADAYGPFVPGEPLDLDLAPVAGWKAAHALPSGLSFSATTGRLTGTPKKPGVYPLVFTRKVGFALRAVSTLVTIAPLRQVKVEAEGEGTVKGAGAYLAHARVTLTAKAAKGYAVLGWYRGEERVSRDASFAYTVGTEAEQTLVAKFVTQEADRASIGVALGETALDPVEALVVTNYQGVAVSWPLACDALTKPTVSVSGLPSGLSFKDGLLKGASTTASTRDKAGTYKPKTAKVTVKTLGGTTAKYAIDFVTLPRPVWAAGSYDGVYSLEGEVAGRVTLTLSPNGKASGKIWTTVDGAAVTATLTAPMITAYDADSDTFRIEATCAVKKQPDQTIVFTLATREADGVGTLEAAGEGDAFTLVQNIWKEKSFDAPAFPSGKKALSLTLPEGLTLKFGAKGVVTCAGKLDGENGTKVSVSGSTQLVLDAEGQGTVLIYLAPKKNFGGFIQCVPLACEVVDGVVTQVGLR